MKQRPIFILLTFFLALTSVVVLTFVFLRTQLNEKKLQVLVAESIAQNFPDYEVNLGHIGLNLGTKFRYKIESVQITHKSAEPFFSTMVLKNVSLKFPLFFLIGKQDIDVGIESVEVFDADFSKFKKQQYRLTSQMLSSLSIPRIVRENRLNITVADVIFKNTLSGPSIPLRLKSLDHLVLRDVSFTHNSAFEINAKIALDQSLSPEAETTLNLVGIGHFNIGQLFGASLPNYKILFEVKSVNNPIYAWLINHRLQISNGTTHKSSRWNIHGQAVDGGGLFELSPDSFSLKEMDVTLNTQEILRENSLLKNIFYLLSETLDAQELPSYRAKINGDLNYFLEQSGKQHYWLSHLQSTWEGNSGTVADKVWIELTTNGNSNPRLHYNIRRGSDLSYRKIHVECSSIPCLEDDLLAVTIEFYNQILAQNDNANGLLPLYQMVAKLWSATSNLVSEKLTTPVKFVWRKTRWNDFEFDLLAESSMNKQVLASDNVAIKQQGKDLAKIKFSLSQADDGMLWRQYCHFNQFPASLVSKIFLVNKAEVNGLMTGSMAFQLSSNKVNISSDFTLTDGSVHWLNFDDLYRKEIFPKPEDEIKFPQLNWSSQFAKARVFTQWDEKAQEVQFDFIAPKTIAKDINIKSLGGNNDYQAEVEFTALNALSKKFLAQNKHNNKIKFAFNHRSDELNRVTTTEDEAAEVNASSVDTP